MENANIHFVMAQKFFSSRKWGDIFKSFSWKNASRKKRTAGREQCTGSCKNIKEPVEASMFS